MQPLRTSFASRLIALVTVSIVTSTMLATGLSALSAYQSNIREVRNQALSIALHSDVVVSIKVSVLGDTA